MSERQSAPAAKPENQRLSAFRNFLRSMNILLKSVRLYGYNHTRTGAQICSAWDDLHVCLRGGQGLRVGAKGSILLLDGEPVQATPAEKSFAELLSHSNITSICFSASCTQDDFIQFVNAFALAGPKLEGLSRKLKEIFQDRAAAIHVNEVHFIALEDPDAEETRVGTPLVDPAQELKKPAGDASAAPSATAEAVRILRVLGMLGEMLAHPDATIDFGRLREQLAQLSEITRAQLPPVSAGLGDAEGARNRLLELAERLAEQFAAMTARTKHPGNPIS